MAANSTSEKNLEKVEISSEIIAEANKSILDDDALRDIKSLDDAFNVLQSEGVVAEDFADYGTGFAVLDSDEKDRLVKTPFMILEWRFNKGDFGDYVAALVVTKGGEKFVVIDGSTGIFKQLEGVTMSRLRKGMAKPQQGLLVPNGLRRSDYDYVDAEGKKRPATTFYLAN